MKEYKILKIFLYLIAAHSFLVGVNLLYFSSDLLQTFGFNALNEPFFKFQGGVFHLVMVAAYLLAAIDPVKNKMIVLFSIIAKLMATIFLFAYYFFYDTSIIVLLSAIGDLIMGIVIFYLYLTAIMKNQTDD